MVYLLFQYSHVRYRNRTGFHRYRPKRVILIVNRKDFLFSQDQWSLEDPAKRRLVMQMLCSGALGSMPFGAAQAFWFGSKTKQLSDDKSIFTLKGDVRVNDEPADTNTRIRAGDTVRTGHDSEIVFAVGGDSFIMRNDTAMEISGADFFISSLRILTGRLLSVFSERPAGQRLDLSSSTATIGIRGTGVYLEVEPELTYLCTCYGQVALNANDNPDDNELITTTNHDSPRYIASKSSKGTRIRSAPVKNHTNTELRLLENLVGRDVPKRLRKAYVKY